MRLPRLLPAAALTLALFLSACAAETVREPGMPAPAGPAAAPKPDTATPDPELPALTVAAGERPWYAERFERLGFFVFPEPVPLGDFALEPLERGATKFSDLRGRAVLLNFWATWCPPCRLEMPSIEALWRKTRDKPFSVVAVSVGEGRQTVGKFIASEKYSFPIYLDPSGALGSAFNARSIPTTYVVDKEGRAVAGIVGSRMYDGPEVVALLTELAER